ncbi:hypothetical protein J437_LFUL007742 [Ladona fulva]|uniref:Reverse transcriptase n=1 Tax=Ladona fulva TaxID=123851 RepID=A0A8K0KHW3_LADFU|nr:hypothetical protein J437_LFUL007742 [Ladona fulva]
MEDTDLKILSLNVRSVRGIAKWAQLTAFMEAHRPDVGFGLRFTDILRTLYNGAVCMIRVGSSLTPPIPFRRGIRQGCPLSGQLFSLAFEPLVRALKSSPRFPVIPRQGSPSA